MRKQLLFLLNLTSLTFAGLLGHTQTLEWAHHFNGTGFQTRSGKAVAYDPSGNCISIGQFKGTVDFDPGTGTFNLSSTSEDIYISKLSPTGDFIWAKQIGSILSPIPMALTIDDSGNIFLAGKNQYATDFDPGAGSFNLNSAGGFIVKLDSEGKFVWASLFSGGSCEVSAIKTDLTGNVYSTGTFLSTTDFDPGSGTSNRSSAGAADIFIAKLDLGGNLRWVKQIGSSAAGEFSHGLALDSDGRPCITGEFNSSAGALDFDPGAGSSTLTTQASGWESFVCKLDSAGSFMFARQLGGHYAKGIAMDEDDNLIVSGYFSNTRDFDPSAGTYTMTSPGSAKQDIFISKLDPSGNLVWARQLGGSSNDWAYAVAVDANNAIYCTGYYESLDADFNPGPENYNLSANGKGDAFVSKLDALGNFAWAFTLGGKNTSEYDAGNSIAVDSTCMIYLTGDFYDTTDFNPGTAKFLLAPSTSGIKDAFVARFDGCNSVGVANFAAGSAAIELFPNPATNEITLSNIGQGSLITVYDLKGTSLLSIQNAEKGEVKIPISHLQKGVYLSRIIHQGTTTVLKFFVL